VRCTRAYKREEEKSWRMLPRYVCVKGKKERLWGQKSIPTGSSVEWHRVESGEEIWAGVRAAEINQPPARPTRGDAINIVHCTNRSHTAADYDDFFGPQHTPDAHYVLWAARLISRLPIVRFIAGGISFWAF